MPVLQEQKPAGENLRSAAADLSPLRGRDAFDRRNHRPTVDCANSHPHRRAGKAAADHSGPRSTRMGVGFRRPTWMWEMQIMQEAVICQQSLTDAVEPIPAFEFDQRISW